MEPAPTPASEENGSLPRPAVLAVKQDFNKRSEFAIIHRFSHVTEHGLHPSVHLCIYSFIILIILLIIFGSDHLRYARLGRCVGARFVVTKNHATSQTSLSPSFIADAD